MKRILSAVAGTEGGEGTSAENDEIVFEIDGTLPRDSGFAESKGLCSVYPPVKNTFLHIAAAPKNLERSKSYSGLRHLSYAITEGRRSWIELYFRSIPY